MSNVISFFDAKHKSTINQFNQCSSYFSCLHFVSNRITNQITDLNNLLIPINITQVDLNNFLLQSISDRYNLSISHIHEDLTNLIAESVEIM